MSLGVRRDRPRTVTTWLRCGAIGCRLRAPASARGRAGEHACEARGGLGRGNGERGRARGTARRRDQGGEGMSAASLPELLDARGLRAELGVSRAAAEAIMRRLPTVQIEGLRKTYVRRDDVALYLEQRTFAK